MTVQGGLTSGKELYCWNKRGGMNMGEKINNVLKGEIISSVFYILLGLCLILIPTQTVDVICKVVFGLSSSELAFITFIFTYVEKQPLRSWIF